MKIIYRTDIIRKLTILIITGISIFLFSGGWLLSPQVLASDHNNNKFRKGPYLIYQGKNTEMKVLWQLYRKSECRIRWGIDPSYLSQRAKTIEYGSDHQHAYTLKNLKPGTRYDYQVIVNDESYHGSFYAAPDESAKKLKFMVYGDSRSHPEIHNRVAEGIVSTYTVNKDFQTLIISSGDLVKFGAEESEWDEQFFDPAQKMIQKMLANLPFQSCVGNHELYYKGYKKIDYSLRLFKKYFPYPYVKHAYWSFDYGPVHFVMVDQYYYQEILKRLKEIKTILEVSARDTRKLGKSVRELEKKDGKRAAKYREKADMALAKTENVRKDMTKLEKQFQKTFNIQLSWLKKDLASSKKVWKFLVYHEPGWSAGGSYAHPNNTVVQRYLQPLMERYNVSMAFAGHNHYYARALVKGVHHITTGGGGAPLYNPDRNSPNVVTSSKANHFCKVEIEDNILRFSAVKPDGTVINTFTINK